MSDSIVEDSPGARSPWKAGTPSARIWLVSCLVHLGLLWALSTMPTARGVGGSSDAGGLTIEGRFLGTSVGEWGDGGPDADGPDAAPSGAEFRLVSATPANSEPFEGVEEESSPEESVDSAEDSEATQPNRRSISPTQDSTVIDPDVRAARRGERTRPSREAEIGIDRSGRSPGRGHAAGGGAGSGKGGGTTFFDVAGRGTKFVYVIDRSDSMQHKRRLNAARSELLASLAELAETNFVQVIFYNDDVVSLSSSERPTLLRNTTVQQRKIAQFAAGIQPDGGTDHLRALQIALQLAPDAIFLLTDADEPKLHAADLDRLSRANRRRVPIHAIELGIGPLLESDNFLMRLARQNQGTYRYWNVEDLSRP
jgi:Ca-activated chloride channel family protein